MDRSDRVDPVDGDDDDVVEQSGHHFPALNWRPPRGAVLAAGLAAGLVIGLAGGYAAGKRHAGAAASGTTASPVILTEPDSPVLDQSAQCSGQTGRELQLGVQVTNQTPTRLTLRQVTVVLPLGGLKPVSVHWAPCGTVPESQTAPGNQVPPGAIAWVTVTLQVLTKCPGPLPVQFTVDYIQNGQLGSARLPGFPDLTHVPYSGCPGQSSPLRVQRQALEDLVDGVAGPMRGDAREPKAARGHGPDDGTVVLIVPGREHSSVYTAIASPRLSPLACAADSCPALAAYTTTSCPNSARYPFPSPSTCTEPSIR